MKSERKTVFFWVCCAAAATATTCGKSDPDPSQLDLVGPRQEESDPIRRTPEPSPMATDNSLVIDLITDLVFRKDRDGWTLLTEHAQVNVEKLKRGGVNFFLSALPVTRGVNPYKSLLDNMAKNRALVEETRGAVRIVSSFREVSKYMDENVITTMVLLEGGDGLADRPEAIPALKKQGLGVIGLVGSHGNALADSAKHPRPEGGLTKKGMDFLRVCRDHGIAVDVTHLSNKGFWDVLKEQAGVVFATHVAARALRDHPRNLNDLQILGLSRYGGVMGLVFNPELLKPLSEGRAAISDLVAHVMHIKALGALHSLALGTDFGGIRPPTGMGDISQLLTFRQTLVNQGMSSAEIKGVFGDNAKILFEEVEREYGSKKLTRDDILRPIATECESATGEHEGNLSDACNGFILDIGARIEQSTRQRIRINEVARTPVKLEIFGQPETPWQVEGQALSGQVLFTRTIALDKKGNAVVSLPQNRGLTRLFFSPTRAATLREVVVWGR